MLINYPNPLDIKCVTIHANCLAIMRVNGVEYEDPFDTLNQLFGLRDSMHYCYIVVDPDTGVINNWNVPTVELLEKLGPDITADDTIKIEWIGDDGYNVLLSTNRDLTDGVAIRFFDTESSWLPSFVSTDREVLTFHIDLKNGCVVECQTTSDIVESELKEYEKFGRAELGKKKWTIPRVTKDDDPTYESQINDELVDDDADDDD